MNNYNDKEIEVMSDDELGQFLSILARMLAHDKKAQTKYKIEFDQAKSYRDELSAAYDKYWNAATDDDGEYLYQYEEIKPPCSSSEIGVVNGKVRKLEFKLKELSHELFYLERTIAKAKNEANARSGVRDKVSSIINDMFDEV